MKVRLDRKRLGLRPVTVLASEQDIDSCWREDTTSR
jgi:hypothetical protein